MELISIWKPVMEHLVIVLVLLVHSIVDHRRLVHFHSGENHLFLLLFIIDLCSSRYHMYGATINTLTIYIRSAGVDTAIWTLQGNQGDKWFEGVAYLPTCASEFNIVVEGIRGTSFTGDIALDDFRFQSCYDELPPPNTCASAGTNSSQFLCRSKHCIPQENICDYQPDCCDGSDEDEFICYTYQR